MQLRSGLWIVARAARRDGVDRRDPAAERVIGLSPRSHPRRPAGAARIDDAARPRGAHRGLASADGAAGAQHQPAAADSSLTIHDLTDRPRLTSVSQTRAADGTAHGRAPRPPDVVDRSVVEFLSSSNRMRADVHAPRAPGPGRARLVQGHVPGHRGGGGDRARARARRADAAGPLPRRRRRRRDARGARRPARRRDRGRPRARPAGPRDPGRLRAARGRRRRDPRDGGGQRPASSPRTSATPGRPRRTARAS